MEHFFFLCAFLFFILMLVKIARQSKPVKLPPGPKPLPIIGNIHQLIGSVPHKILADLGRKHGPLMYLKFGEVPTVIISSAEVAKEFFTNYDRIFASRAYLLSASILYYNCTDIGFAPFGDYWRQLRKICTMELLSPRRVQSFRSIREKEVLNMIKSIALQEGSAVNLSKKISSVTYSITSLAAFGKGSKYHAKFMLVSDEALKLLGGFSIADMYPSVKVLERITGIRKKLEKVHKQVDEVLENILSEHKVKRAVPKRGSGEEAKDQDLVDVLLKVQSSGELGAQLTDNNLKAVIFDMFSGGGETSSTTAEWAIAEMINNPRVMKRAQDEVRRIFGEIGTVDESRIRDLTYLQAVIKETLRLHPPVTLLPARECSERCEIYGYEIPVKTRVIVNVWAIGRDPNYWTDPEKFNPERFLESQTDFRGTDFNYIPFGAGRRICPGVSFALPNIELPLAQLLYHFDWKLPGAAVKQEQLDMSETFGLTTGRTQDLELLPIPYHPFF
ncbi:tabersonine 16-hydroxylase 2-like isoform X1 [Coffea arabica]|uniref:Tabersonine 16-hydroxylase 2-like isoform X1 n=1 Tax=Coffea arabica TaxID=13443 RepID=A0A6P6SBY1_COFAR